MPLDDEASWFSDKMEFDDQVMVLGPRGPQRELALNKQRQTELARQSGFSVPCTFYVGRVGDLQAQPPRIPIGVQARTRCHRNRATALQRPQLDLL